MFRPTRTFLALLFLIALAATAGSALAQPPGPIVINPNLLIRTVTVIAAGDTLESAEAYALADIRTDYFVLSYSTSNAMCGDVPFLVAKQIQEPPMQFCSIVVTARVVRKALRVSE